MLHWQDRDACGHLAVAGDVLIGDGQGRMRFLRLQHGRQHRSVRMILAQRGNGRDAHLMIPVVQEITPVGMEEEQAIRFYGEYMLHLQEEVCQIKQHHILHAALMAAQSQVDHAGGRNNRKNLIIMHFTGKDVICHAVGAQSDSAVPQDQHGCDDVILKQEIGLHPFDQPV